MLGNNMAFLNTYITHIQNYEHEKAICDYILRYILNGFLFPQEIYYKFLLIHQQNITNSFCYLENYLWLFYSFHHILKKELTNHCYNIQH